MEVMELIKNNKHNPPEFWLGLRGISKLTSEGSWQLRVDLEDYEGRPYTAIYNTFWVEEESPYRLHISDFDPESTLQDSFQGLDGMAFSTMDNDNDNSDMNCAETYLGGWWFDHCHLVNLNGYNFNEKSLAEKPENYATGIVWVNIIKKPYQNLYFSWPKVEMKVRRVL